MADSYRPTRRNNDAPRPPPKALADRMTFSHGGGDNYRPGGQGQHQSDFTFEAKHAAPRFPPSGPANPGSRAPARNSRGGGNRGGRRGDHHGRNNAHGPRRGGPFRKAAPHERALLQHRDDGSPEHTYGVSDGPNRFMNVDDLSDDEEAAMVESDASANGDAAEGQNGNHKIARTQAPRADGDAVPQWSNPDPYTSLPPPSESTGVKMDVVQLIRKAKNQAAEKAVGNNAVAANDDFISFGDDDAADAVDDDAGLLVYEDEEHVRGRGNDRHPRHDVQGSLNDFAPVNNVSEGPHREMYDSYQPRQPQANRKRKIDSGVPIVPEWLPPRRSYLPLTPWATDPRKYEHLANDPEKWLHNEILDFYDYVAPKSHEHDARHKLVQRITDALASERWFPHHTGRILCFGSYPAGLYLPSADMDLVYTSDSHFNGGPPVLEAASNKSAFKNMLWKVSRRLQRVGIAVNPVVIAGARVPIIKFQDKITDLDVDISFENLSGVQAQATFDRWKEDYPDMVYMVALVKQLLVMRGLNEVHSGGLGGLSIICLIVNYIHNSRPAENLGDCFVSFLKYYGKEFDLSRQRIQMSPPQVVEKTMYGIDGRQESVTGLSIQDPNKPENNISGGSRKAPEAFGVFSAAFDTLTDRMRISKAGGSIGPSILGSILGGNYESYAVQRAKLERFK